MLTPAPCRPPGEGSQIRAGGPEAAAAEPAVPGALHLPGALQCLPPPGEGRLLEEALQHLDAGGERQEAEAEASQSIACGDSSDRPPADQEAVLFDLGP